MFIRGIKRQASFKCGRVVKMACKQNDIIAGLGSQEIFFVSSGLLLTLFGSSD